MDILDFFQLNAGKWFTHRTTQHLMSHQSRGSQSTWLIKWLDQQSMEIHEACQRMTIASHSILGGLQVTNEPMASNPASKGKSGQPPTSLLLVLPDSTQITRGQILQTASVKKGETRYHFGLDDSLTVVTQYPEAFSEERIRFASPNLRLRSTLVKTTDETSLVSFASEIRLGVPQPKSPSEG